MKGFWTRKVMKSERLGSSSVFKQVRPSANIEIVFKKTTVSANDQYHIKGLRAFKKKPKTIA